MAAYLEEPDYFMMDYYSYKSGQQDYDSQTLVYLKGGSVYDQNRKDEFIGRIQIWLRKCVKKIKAKHSGNEIVFGFVPGHSPSSPDSFMISELARIDEGPHFAVDPKMLKRHKTVEKQATGGPRSIEIHLNSIRVKGDVNGKIVCILDDVWTSGCTMNACVQLLEEKGAKEVYTLIIGKTV